MAKLARLLPASESPNGENLLVVGYEVSGSMGIIQVGGELVSISEELREETDFKAYPNPTVDRIFFEHPIYGNVFDSNGQLMARVQQATELTVSDWPAGIYIIATEKHGNRRFLKF